MKKIIQWLSGGVIKEIGNVIDKLTTTEEERLESQFIAFYLLGFEVQITQNQWVIDGPCLSK